MKIFQKKVNTDEFALLIDQSQSINLEWIESSWFRWPYALIFSWINPLLSCVSKRMLTMDDLNCLPHNDQCSTLYEQINTFNLTEISLLKILLKIFWKRSLLIGFLLLPLLFVRITELILLCKLIFYIINISNSSNHGYFYAIGIFICEIIHALLLQQYYFYSNRLGLMLRNSLSCIVYTHLLLMKSAFSQEITVGFATNLLANDLTKFDGFIASFHFLWGGPLEMSLVFGLLCYMIDFWPAFAGFIVMIFLMFLQIIYSRYFYYFRETTMKYADKRIHAYQELIHGYEIIKINNWEQSIMKRIKDIREQEFSSIRRASFLRAVSMSLFIIAMALIGLAMFTCAWYIGQPLKPTDYFTALIVYGRLRFTALYEIPIFFENFSEIQIVWQRINTLIQLILKQQQQQQQTVYPMSSTYQNEKRGAIFMCNASFSWNNNNNNNCLSSINLNIETGNFVGIIGPVGSGKSSLLAAILGEMIQVDGQININNSSFSYASQSPWIFSDTLRANILFGKSFDKQRYNDVLHACCLDIDLNQFGTSGDLTIIGERGINLSGGQKSRVSLARALYADADIYLLDDPLAAVDRTVSKQIYDRCIGLNSLLKDKTRLLVTHQREFLHGAHQIIVLVQGQIQTETTFDEPVDLITNNLSKIEPSTLEIDQRSSDIETTIEDKEVWCANSVKWSVWYSLFTAPPLGIFGLCLMIILLLTGEILYDGTNFWVSNQSRQSTTIYIYLGLMITTLIVLLIRSILFYYHILNGSNHFHNQMLEGLSYTSLHFYETNSTGRILNRVSKDQQIIDESVPATILEGTQILLVCLGAVIMSCIINFWNIFLVIFTILLLWILHRYYMKLNYPLTRLENITRSPIYAQLSASLDGLPTIRSFKVENQWFQMFMNHVDTNSQASINANGASRWFGLRVDLLMAFYIFIFIIIMIISRDRIDSSLQTFILMSTINAAVRCQWGMRKLSDAKALMISAERIFEYGKLPQEVDKVSQDEIQLPDNWPNNCTIEFRNYSMCYESRHEMALKNINFSILSGEKIGIIGRTGAGKSSLFRCLLRLIDHATINGQIFIDNIDINQIPLKKLRSYFSVIPQRPILFAGTLRYNLDLWNIYSDEQCWMALETVQLKQWASEHTDGLLLSINEAGSNLSIGQSHLICIARAILKKTKFILVDEATANVDKETDRLIHSIIVDKFSDRTMLTIAHRLNTVTHNNRILVMDKGTITHIDIPSKILPYFY